MNLLSLNHLHHFSVPLRTHAAFLFHPLVLFRLPPLAFPPVHTDDRACHSQRGGQSYDGRSRPSAGFPPLRGGGPFSVCARFLHDQISFCTLPAGEVKHILLPAPGTAVFSLPDGR